jgi:hypothetical protein
MKKSELFLIAAMIGAVTVLSFKLAKTEKRVTQLEQREKWFAPWFVHGKELTLDEFREAQGWVEVMHGEIGEIKPGDSVSIYPETDTVIHKVHTNGGVILKTNLPGDAVRSMSPVRFVDVTRSGGYNINDQTTNKESK